MAAMSHANPFIFRQLIALKNGKRFSDKDTKRIVQTAFNYWHRCHFDTTPFGLLASLSYIPTNKDQIISPWKPDHHIRIRLDLSLLDSLIGVLRREGDVLDVFKVYTNNSIYKLGHELRYNEKHVNPVTGVANFELSSVEYNDGVQSILDYCQDGRTMDEICDKFQLLAESRTELRSFVVQLVENQILRPEYEITLAGEDPFAGFCERLNKAAERAQGKSSQRFLESYAREVALISAVLDKKNDAPVNRITADELIDTTAKIQQILARLTDRAVNEKKVIHVDTFFRQATREVSLPKTTLDELSYVINQLGQLSNFPSGLDGLKTFKSKFKNKYGNKIVDLMEVLDTDVGISYGTFVYHDDNVVVNANSPDGVRKARNSKIVDYVDNLRLFFYKHIIRALREGKVIVNLTAKDFEQAEKNDTTDHFNQSIQAIVKEYALSDQRKFFLHSFGNSSAGNLFSRFTHGSEEIEELLRDVFRFEDDSAKDSIIAEIVHVSEPRLGNITQKSISRDYEIPIITRSLKEVENQIRLDDLHVTVVGEEVILFSGRLKRRVIPKLTSAHNYNRNTIPVYQFLGDLAYQNNVPNVDINLGEMASNFPYIPRISYGSIVLVKRSWFINYEELEQLRRARIESPQSSVTAFIEKHNLNQIVEYLDNGLSLIVDWKNPFLVEQLFSRIRRSLVITFQEVYEQGVDNTKGGAKYSKEYIVPFKNSPNLSNSREYVFNRNVGDSGITQTMFPGKSCAYVKIYCSRNSYPIFLREFSGLLADLDALPENLRCFFLPYNDGEFHVRLRVLGSHPLSHRVRDLVDAFVKYLEGCFSVSKIVYDTYVRELDRYNHYGIHLAERLFSEDSKLISRIWNSPFKTTEITGNYLPLLAVYTVDKILDVFELSAENKFKFITFIKEAYFNEFGVEGRKDALYQDIINKERDLRQYTEPPALATLIGDEEFNLLSGMIADYQHTAQEAVKAHKASQAISSSFVSGIVHMHMIRLFPSLPRKNELYIYYLLYCKYKKSYYKQRAKASTVVA